MNKSLHIIYGPTGVGKTEFALKYAEKNNGEIISSDASLVYKGMDLGTAKPTKEELEKIAHYCIDLHPVDKSCDIKLFSEAAKKAVNIILNKNKSVIIAGGSGFYLKSFFEPVLDKIFISDKIKAKVEKIWFKKGLEGLITEINEVSPEGLGNLDTKNPRRVQRALERCWASGKSVLELQLDFSNMPKPYMGFDKKFILLNRDPDDLTNRIESRVDSMINEGLVNEVKALIRNGIEKNPNASNAIGYKETIAFIKGEINLEELRLLIIKNTLKLVRKQNKWFRSQLPNPDLIINLSNN